MKNNNEFSKNIYRIIIFLCTICLLIIIAFSIHYKQIEYISILISGLTLFITCFSIVCQNLISYDIFSKDKMPLLNINCICQYHESIENYEKTANKGYYAIIKSLFEQEKIRLNVQGSNATENLIFNPAVCILGKNTINIELIRRKKLNKFHSDIAMFKGDLFEIIIEQSIKEYDDFVVLIIYQDMYYRTYTILCRINAEPKKESNRYDLNVSAIWYLEGSLGYKELVNKKHFEKEIKKAIKRYELKCKKMWEV